MKIIVGEQVFFTHIFKAQNEKRKEMWGHLTE